MNIIEVLRLPIGTKVIMKSNKVTSPILKVMSYDEVKWLKFEKGSRVHLDSEITEMEFEFYENRE